jgi:hypothetical protein
MQYLPVFQVTVSFGLKIYSSKCYILDIGKSAGARTIVAFGIDKKVFFVYGYEKNARSNISEQEEIALKKLAKLYFSFSDKKLTQAVLLGELVEVN